MFLTLREINRLPSFEAGQVSINTSLFSDAFKGVFKDDGLGSFSFTSTASTGGDNTLFNIDKKTGEITSKAAWILKLPQIRLEADQLLAITFMTFEVTYNTRDGSSHTEVIHLTITDKATLPIQSRPYQPCNMRRAQSNY